MKDDNEMQTLTEHTDEKSAEQLAHDFNLDAAIPDHSETEQGATDQTNAAAPDATEALYGMLCLVPIGLNIAGLFNTANVWNENACRSLSGATIPVLRKYAWGQSIITFLETGGGVEEIALAAAIAPLALATYAAYRKDTYVHEKEVEATEDGTIHDAGN